MGGILNKKASAAVGVIIIIIIIILSMMIGAAIKRWFGECDDNDDCGEEAYCGSDYECHAFPVIEKEVVKKSPTTSAILIAAAIVIAAIILRWRK